MNDMNKFTWIKWHEWSELKRMFWNEWLERNNLATLSSKSGPMLSVFLRFLCEIELSLQSRAHFVDVIFKKCQKLLVFFTIFMWNRALATVSCTFCRPLSGSSRETAETETLQRQPRTATLPEETQGFAPESVFSREFTRSRSLTLLNYFMMMWLTWWLRWWCSCHDGETASHWETSVIWKFLN